MNIVKRIKVPFISGLESMDPAGIDLAMETYGSKFWVCENNWAKDFPYAPDCVGTIAMSESYLAVTFRVRGLDLRATALEDNGRSWEDSCVEFFVSDPYDGSYYNFELTAIGSLLADKKKTRADSERFSEAKLSRIIRYTTLERKAYDESDSVFSWSVVMMIPFDLIGFEKGKVPVSIRGNFYKCGDKTAHPHYLSWNPIKTPRPDFHRPEFFGELILR